MSRPLIIDSFAGGGGASEGIRAAICGQAPCMNSTTCLRPSDHKCLQTASIIKSGTVTKTVCGKLTKSTVSSTNPYLLWLTTTQAFEVEEYACIIVPTTMALFASALRDGDNMIGFQYGECSNDIQLCDYSKVNLQEPDLSVGICRHRGMGRLA